MGRTALWTAISDTLTDEIARGLYRPGDRLPTETRLSDRFGVNRHTVRRALAAMAEGGLVQSRRGAGVYVRHRPTVYPISRRVRFHDNLRAMGRRPSKRVLHLETRRSDAREAEALHCAEGDMVHVYEGISLADDAPMAVFQSLFPAARFPRMLDALSNESSVTAALNAHGLSDYVRVRTEVTAKLATPILATHLQIKPGDPILRTIAVNVDPNGNPVEYGRTWFAADRVALTLTEESGPTVEPTTGPIT